MVGVRTKSNEMVGADTTDRKEQIFNKINYESIYIHFKSGNPL